MILFVLFRFLIFSESSFLTFSSLFQAAWRTASCVLGGVMESVFGASVFREGASQLGFYCDHQQNNRLNNNEQDQIWSFLVNIVILKHTNESFVFILIIVFPSKLFLYLYLQWLVPEGRGREMWRGGCTQTSSVCSGAECCRAAGAFPGQEFLPLKSLHSQNYDLLSRWLVLSMCLNMNIVFLNTNIFWHISAHMSIFTYTHKYTVFCGI